MGKANKYPSFAIPLLLLRREEMKRDVETLRARVSTLLREQSADQAIVAHGLMVLQEAEKALKELDSLIHDNLGLRLS